MRKLIQQLVYKMKAFQRINSVVLLLRPEKYPSYKSYPPDSLSTYIPFTPNPNIHHELTSVISDKLYLPAGCGLVVSTASGVTLYR